MIDEERTEEEFTVDDLFRISLDTTITVFSRQIEVTLKTLGDADNRMRQRLGTKASSDAIKQLDDPNSLLYAERVAPLYEMSDDDLATILKTVKQTEFYDDATRDILPEAPDDDEYTGLTGLAEREAFEDAERERVEEAREEYARNAAAEYVDVARKDKKGFRSTALAEIETFVKEIAAREAFQVAWTNATMFYGVWKPGGKERFYDSIGDWDNASQDFKRLCLDAYLKLDKASKDPNVLSALR